MASDNLLAASFWPLVVTVLGIVLTDSAAAGLAAGAGVGMLMNIDLILIVKYVQRYPSTERVVVSAIGMIAGLAVLWGGSNWAAGNLFTKLPDPGDFSTHYWLGSLTIASIGLIWTAIQFLLWAGE